LEAIRNNKLQPEAKIDNEIKLSKLFNVSRPTIRQALKELEIKGYIKKIKGSGTFIAKRKLESNLFNKFISATEDLKNQGRSFQNKILKAEQKKASSIKNSSIDFFDSNERINYVERIRFVDGKPFNFTKFYVRDYNCKNFFKSDLKKFSCFEIWRKQYKLKIDLLKRILFAVTTDFNKKASKLLGLKPCSAIHYM